MEQTQKIYTAFKTPVEPGVQDENMKQEDIHRLMTLELETLQTDGGVDLKTINTVQGGCESLFYKLLERIEEINLIPGINSIGRAINNKNTGNIYYFGRALRDACQYVGGY